MFFTKGSNKRSFENSEDVLTFSVSQNEPRIVFLFILTPLRDLLPQKYQSNLDREEWFYPDVFNGKIIAQKQPFW